MTGYADCDNSQIKNDCCALLYGTKTAIDFIPELVYNIIHKYVLVQVQSNEKKKEVL